MRINGSTPYIALLCAIGCSGDPATGGGAGTGGSAPMGGQSGAAGAAVSGGAAFGGSPGFGGASGGATVTSGGSSGGVLSTGGVSAGGSAGAATGGSAGAPSGGKSNGGSAGTATGGSGGAATGGFAGAPSGGKSNGGSAGAATGGSGGGGDAQQFFASNCASCHGARGEGVPTMGPEIQHPVRDFSTWVVRNGRQGHPSFSKSAMPAFTTTALPDATLNAIFDWLSTPTLPKPTTGKALFEDYCATCHGATGAGGPAGHNAKGEPLSKAISMARSGHSLTQFSSRTSYMPKWSATELTDAEIGLIVTYLDSL